MRNHAYLLFALVGLLAAACGSDTKDESTTPDKAVKETKAAGTPATAGGTQVAQAPAPAPGAPAPAPAAPAPAPIAASGTAGPPPTGFVRNALLMARRGRYEDAIREAKAALKRDEKYVPAMVVMARAYYHLNKTEFADSICDIALGINPNVGECYNLKGFIALKENDDTTARTMFEKATQVQPNLGAAWLNLGAQYLKVKNYGAAIPVLERATQLMPGRAEAHLNLGSAYRGAAKPGDNQVVKAQQSYSKAIQIKPTYPAAYFNLGILFLDAQSFPGMDKLQQLNTAVTYFNKYKQQVTYLAKDDPVDAYIKEAQKAHEREVKNREREARRKAREAAKKAAPKPAEKPAEKKGK
jgi:tetratricopeptide (TPR) repeat protein